MTGTANREDGGEEGAITVEDVKGYRGAIGPVCKAEDGGKATMGEEDAKHFASI